MSKKFTLVLDSSQITQFLTCQQAWYNRYVKRLVPAALADSNKEEAMNAGTYGHKLLDIYYRGKARHAPLNQIVEECFAYDPDIHTCECGCEAYMHKPLPAIGIVECQRCKGCYKFRPKPFPLSQDLRFKVRNRFRDYVAYYQRSDFEPLSEQHVEVGFSEPIYEDDENLFVLEGRMDLVGQQDGLQVLVDHKFQLSTHWLYPRSVQFKNYAMVSKCPILIINYVRLQNKIQADSLSRDIVSFTMPELRIWHERLLEIYLSIRDVIQSDYFEKNWNACSGYGKTYRKEEARYCFYNALCEEADLDMAKLKEEKLYKIREDMWRPW